MLLLVWKKLVLGRKQVVHFNKKCIFLEKFFKTKNYVFGEGKGDDDFQGFIEMKCNWLNIEMNTEIDDAV